MDALVACSEQASAQFPVLEDIPSSANETGEDAFRVDAGAFVWDVSVEGQGRAMPDRLTCRGSVNQRAIESVEFNGVVKRPSAQEVWKF